MKKYILLAGMLFSIYSSTAQGPSRLTDKLKVFIDCSTTYCDMTFIRTEINLVDFMLDRVASDVHVLITDQGTGSGGTQYQLIFFGQNLFRQMTDTIRFNTDPNSTDFERRDQLIKYIKMGLSPYVAKTKKADDVVIQMKSKDGEGDKKDSSAAPVKDPWNYWVFRIGVNGYISADAVYKSSRLSGNFSANRVTEDLKTGFEFYGGKNKTTFTLDDNGNTQKIHIDNNDYSLEHYLVKSLGGHWSWGYETTLSRNTFSNNKSRVSLETGVEYAIFPYKEVNTKFFTVAYTVDIMRAAYFDTTLYDKTKETLLGHSLESKFRFNQKWGTVSFGASYHNFLHNWKLFNLGFNSEINVRITGGLSFNVYTYAELTRDQIFLPKEGATPQEVLTRRRQLASGYNIYTYFGINYRFGSKLNNFVNPRFD